MVEAAIDRLNLRYVDNDSVKFAFRLMLGCGLRRNEMLQLSVESLELDGERCYVVIPRRKSGAVNKRQRIPGPLAVVARQYVARRRAAGVPDSYKIVEADPSTFYRWMKRVGKMTKLPALCTPRSESHECTITHLPRKTKAQALYLGQYGYPQAGLGTIAKILDHRSVVTTSRYIRADQIHTDLYYDQLE